MSKMCAIYKKDLMSYFSSPIAYILMGAYLVLTGIYFCGDVFQNGIATMYGTFGFMMFLFLLICPILTMKLIAEEKKMGTDQLLLTSPLRAGDIVLGKFFAALTLYTAMLLLTVIYPITLYYYSKIDLGPILTSYIGLLLAGGVFISVGLFASSLTENQIIAAVIGFSMLMVLIFIEGINYLVQGSIQTVMSFLSIINRFSKTFQIGILDAGDIFYLISFIFVFLLITISVIQRYRWRRG